MENVKRDQLFIRLAPAEKALLHAAAAHQSMTFSQWARSHLKAAAKREARADMIRVRGLVGPEAAKAQILAERQAAE